MKANHPSPVLNDCGFAVWASRMIPNPSLNGSKSTIRSYRTRNLFFGPEKYRCLVVNPSRPVSWWTVSPHSTCLLRKVLGRYYRPRATLMVTPWELPRRSLLTTVSR